MGQEMLDLYMQLGYFRGRHSCCVCDHLHFNWSHTVAYTYEWLIPNQTIKQNISCWVKHVVTCKIPAYFKRKANNDLIQSIWVAYNIKLLQRMFLKIHPISLELLCYRQISEPLNNTPLLHCWEKEDRYWKGQKGRSTTGFTDTSENNELLTARGRRIREVIAEKRKELPGLSQSEGMLGTQSGPKT